MKQLNTNTNTKEPIAIIGMSLRFPGDIADTKSFWDVLSYGKDMVTQIGADRWATTELAHPSRNEAGRSITFAAGVLSDIAGFDAGFFSISPREAAWLDPQQRLLLELAWEAMENAGIPASGIAGSNCSVFVGISSLDYGVRGIADLESMSSHTMTGNTLSLAANRISYVFDLHGPSLSVDTACSSALVALHQACNSLHAGESPMAIVGSVNLLLHPYPFVGFTKASMISAGGRCKTFDATADGYVRSEGGGVLLLKSLSAALRDGDSIHALIRGSGVNADGGRKTGITIPSSEGQMELMRRVQNAANINPAMVDYVEAHGTGTAIGDPVETHAIGQVYGKGRSSPLPIGSVKTNLGHLEAASGMAGLMKTILMLKQDTLAPSLHCKAPNPAIDFDDLNLAIVQQAQAIQKPNDQPRIMAVNSFGFGGSNAHVILEAYRTPPKNQEAVPTITPPLVLSAKTPEALRAVAGQYAVFIDSTSVAYYDIAYTAAYHREQLPCRLALLEQDSAALKLFAAGEAVPKIMQAQALAEVETVAFVYTGNGAHWAGMAQQLLTESSLFRELIEKLDILVQQVAGFSILEAIRAPEDAYGFDDTRIVQPVLFAIQVGITELLRSEGITPAATIGHSVGEAAAAWAAGILDLEQAIRLVCARSEAQAETRGNGRMAAIAMAEADVRRLLQDPAYAGVEIAGMNSPKNSTVSGDLPALQRLEAYCIQQNIFFKLLDLDYAFHSAAMDSVESLFLDRLGAVTPTPSTLDFVSTVTGNLENANALDAAYWWDNIRQPVCFGAGIDTLIQRGHRVFIEISPNAILQRYIGECLNAAHVTGRVLSTLTRKKAGLAHIKSTALEVHLLYSRPDFGVYFPHRAARVDLPLYPWQRERHWLPTSNGYDSNIEHHRIHPLLGWRVKGNEPCWENVLDLAHHGYLSDHKVSETIVFPAAGTVEIMLAVAHEHFGNSTAALEELEIVAPIILDQEQGRSIRIELNTQTQQVHIYQKERLSEAQWALHAVCKLLSTPPSAPVVHTASNIEKLGGIAADAAQHYLLAQQVGLEYGAAFQGFAGGMVHGDTVEATLKLPLSIAQQADAYFLHPSLLDSCFQAMVWFFKAAISGGRGMQLLPVKIGKLDFYGGVAEKFTLTLLHTNPRSIRMRVTLYTATNIPVAVLEDCVFRMSSFHQHLVQEPASWHTDLIPTAHPLHATDNQQAWLRKTLEQSLVQAATHKVHQAYLESAEPLLHALIASFAYEAFAACEQHNPDWLNTVLGTHMPQQGYVQWLGALLQEHNLLKIREDQYILNTTNPPPSAISIWQTLLAEFPDVLAELILIGRIGSGLPAILSGVQSGEGLLCTLNESYFFEQWLSHSAAFYASNQALLETLQAMVQKQGTQQQLRVLFISGGANAYARKLAALTQVHPFVCVLAEENSERLSRLKADYQTALNVTVAEIDGSTATLTADHPLPEKYDVIISYQWLHQMPDAFPALQSLLAPHGQLIVAESPPNYSADFIFGLAPSWWHGRASSLVCAQEWVAYAEKNSCDTAAVISLPNGVDTSAYFISISNSTPEERCFPASAHWCLIHDQDGVSRRLADALAKELNIHNQNVTLCSLWQDNLPATAQHLVYLAGLPNDEAVSMPSLIRGHDILHLSQHLSKNGLHPRLWLITSGGASMAQPLQKYTYHPNEAAIWGEGRVMMNEYPELRTTLLDIPCVEDLTELLPRLLLEFLTPDDEREIILTSHTRYVLRSKKSNINNAAQPLISRFRLDFKTPGQLRNLQWFPLAERTLADEEIEVAVAATGLNFRDVMYTMGLLPDEAVESGFSGASLGLEFSGTITRMGKRVHDYKVGDAVMGFGPACFSSHVITNADAVTLKPAHWSFAQAATVPTAFFTAYYALKYLAGVQPGERVLIHGAAGGVGIAAIQIAKYLGAEVYATAGNDEKRTFATLLGADHLFDSRSLKFADEIMRQTEGEGVDVVLNSLAGEAINRNLKILKPFGRFLELGKRDFYENTHIGLRPFKSNISYFGIDADQLLTAKPRLANKIFGEMMELFADGTFSPLPLQSYAAASVVDAFRSMQQSRHIGKIIVDFSHAAIPATQTRENQPTFQKNATYIITGGTSGFGAETAQWLAKHGAGHIVLLSRRGVETPKVAAILARIEELGATVAIYACDVADHAAVSEIFAKLKTSAPPIRGIFHAAMVLDDGLMQTLTAARMEAVFAPKAQGAWNLHQLTSGMDLDYFALYSSITTMIGNPGQANYVAANAYLESLALLRRSEGLPAQCVCWGAIGDAGYLTRNTAVKESLTQRLGASPITAAQALRYLGKNLNSDTVVQTVADFQFKALARVLPAAPLARFDYLRRETIQESDSTLAGDLMTELAAKTPEEAQEVIQEIVLHEAGKILSVSAERINPSLSIHDLGMDSLMLVELALAIEQRFGFKLAAMELKTAATSIESISKSLAKKLKEDNSTEADHLIFLMQTIETQHGSDISAQTITETMQEIRLKAT